MSKNQVLNYAITSREVCREFKSSGYICKECPSKHLCTENAKFEKMVTKHIWFDYLETVEDIRHTLEYKALYKRRKETIGICGHKRKTCNAIYTTLWHNSS